jgi:hypothetical protein
MTTRRVILLVLVMLLVTPVFQLGETDSNYQDSVQYGLDLINVQFNHYLKAVEAELSTKKAAIAAAAGVTDPLSEAATLAIVAEYTARGYENPEKDDEFMRAEVLTMPTIRYRKKKYERHLLAYMYMHNNHMFTVPETVCEGAACPNDVFGSLLWMGFSGEYKYKAMQPHVTELLPTSSYGNWDDRFNRHDADKGQGFHAGKIPGKIQDKIMAKEDPVVGWDAKCDHHFYCPDCTGVSMTAVN